MQLTGSRTLMAVLVAVVIIISGLFLADVFKPSDALGSVVDTAEYMSTTTFAASVPVQMVLKSGGSVRATPGSLAQVVITGKNTGLMTLYDATTSDVNLRTGQKATSTILLADFPTNAPEGTYTFDAKFNNGLLLIVSGAPATSTIMWR